MTGTKKSEGLTASERYLKHLCERSFLSLWSYANLFRDQGGGHELCDLLVVFGDDVIIFSDKSCAFPDTGDSEMDWRRWFKRAVADSAKQLFGAERWIKHFPERVFIDPQCTTPFPLNLSDPARLRFHRVVVALGAGQQCRATLGGSGSLMLMPSDPVGNQVPFHAPFSTGWVIPGKPYVHVFDDVTLDVLLRELDTVADFTEYLGKKEEFIAAGRLGFAPGEEELLGLYLRTMDDDVHTFSTDDSDCIVIAEGFWEDLVQRPECRAKKQRDAQSYLWDALVESFAGHLQAGTLARGQEHGVAGTERVLRALASESRLARRSLADYLDDLVRKTKPGATSTRLFLASGKPHRAYVFCVVSAVEYDDYDHYRDHRQSRLTAYCLVAKHLHPNITEVIGIGLDTMGGNGGSEDVVFIDVREWTEEQAEQARQLHEEIGLLRNVRVGHWRENEFPQSSQAMLSPAERRRARNAKKRARRSRASKGR